MSMDPNVELELVDRVAHALRTGRLDRRTFLGLASALGLGATFSSFLAACVQNPGPSSNQPAQSPRPGGTLVIGAESDFEPLDPGLVIGSQTARITQNHIFESLMQPDFTSSTIPPPFRPGLAKSWDISSDGLTYTFHLQEGVKFHDGTDFNADAVKWNIERFWDQSKLGRKNAPWMYDKAVATAGWRTDQSGLTRVDVVDPATVRLVLAHPYNQFLRLLGQGDVGSFCMISPASYAKYGNAGIATHPIGTGPFKFKERIEGQNITLVRNDNYWDSSRKPYLDQLVWRPLGDTAARENALRGGDVQVIFEPSPDSVAAFKSRGFTVSTGPMPHIWVLLMNSRNPAMSKLNVRLAVQHAINRAGMAHDLLRDTALPAESWLSRTSPDYDPSARWWPYDPVKARQLLSDAGAVGTNITFTTSTSGSGQMQPVQMAEWIQRDLNAVGFKTNIQTFEWVAYTNTFFDPAGLKPEWSVSQMSWGWTGEYWLNIFLDPSSGYDVSQVNIPALVDLLKKAEQTLDPQEAMQLYRQVDKGVKDSGWWMPVVNDLAPVVLDKRVHDFVHAGDWQMGFFGNVWLSE